MMHTLFHYFLLLLYVAAVTVLCQQIYLMTTHIGDKNPMHNKVLTIHVLIYKDEYNSKGLQ